MFEDEQLDAELLLRHVQEARQLGHWHGGVQLQEAVGMVTGGLNSRCVIWRRDAKHPSPPNGGELSLLLHLLSEHLELLLEGLLVVVGVNVVIVWHHRRQELRTGKAEQLLKHLQVSEMRTEQSP